VPGRQAERGAEQHNGEEQLEPGRDRRSSTVADHGEIDVSQEAHAGKTTGDAGDEIDSI
jgi:hypothetical protein